MTYYPINEEAARRAKEANSFYEYQPGSATELYRAKVDRAYAQAERQKQRVDPRYHEKIDRLADAYAKKLADNMNAGFAIEARVPSVMIAGPANFPVRQKEKQNAARDRNMGEGAYIEGLLDKIHGTGTGGISADDPRAVEKLEAEIVRLVDSQRQMKEVNAYYRKHKTLDGCPHLSDDTVLKLKASMNRDWRKDGVPFPAYALSNNNQNIHRLMQRVHDLKQRSEYAGWTFEGGRAEVNESENRLQLFFDEKPGDEQRKTLKQNGFRWAPSQGAWQRQLTRNAIHSAGRIDFVRPADGKTPYQHQPFAHRPAPDRSER